jgi:hypothetical protein
MYMSFKLPTFLFLLAGTLAAVPVASATSIKEEVSLGGTQIGTILITQGGMCNSISISSTSVCVDIQMKSGSTVRLGGPVIGFSGNVNVMGSTAVSDVSMGALSIGKACGGVGKETICLDAKGSITAGSLFFVLSNADTSTGIEIGNLHVASGLCSPSATCFATTSPSVVPEPSTMGLMGTGLLLLGSFVRRRFLPQS